MLKKKEEKNKHSSNKAPLFNRECFLLIINNLYLDKIQINQMIAHLQGKLVEKTPTHVIIDCGGIGYHVNISLHTYSLLPWRFYQIVHSPSNKEDAHTLFGFIEKSEREILNCYFQFQVLT
jgi:hypothetical protein